MPKKATYNEINARICAELSYLVYEYPYTIRREAPKILNNNKISIYIRTIKYGDARTLIIFNDKETYVIFRGTINTINSWKQNAYLSRKPWMKGKVHNGFLNLLKCSKSFFGSKIKMNNKVFFAGHSQGGAVAFLAGINNSFSFPSCKREIYTFGQPRAGSKKLCKYAEYSIGKDYIRIANKKDPVIGTPPIRLGFDHTRSFFHYTKYKTITRCSRGFGTGWYPFNPFKRKDHYMINYLNAAKNYKLSL